ncbi:hypothetical protein H072_6562 [Dactylellina haptotyla CBS 200.50]|uniref:Guanine nucleotide-exchange factor SEC12 n=1 Tax=Dactylellina haptotyla (strain CBS 200.50) TaxID=1284197 RepID=S8AES4_DACHA|nr:hypothetical protein H072_6562 [Dactylellina haptotyla CBS 200.50]
MAAPNTSKLTLKYPLFCAEYLDEKTLLIAGGGGESRSGVENGIQLIDTSAETLTVKSSLLLPRNEDAVMSCAILPSKQAVLAGINQTTSTLQSGTNTHFRTFRISDETPEVKEISAREYFRPKAWDDVYQRVTKSSPSGRYAAIASSVPLVRGEGTYGGEVVVLSVDEKGFAVLIDRVVNESEIVDVDIIPATDSDEISKKVEYVAYSTPSSVYIRKITPSGLEAEKLVYTLPGAPKAGSSSRTKPQIRSTKLLSPTLFLLLINLPYRSGVELQLVSVPLGNQSSVLESHKYHPPSAFRAGISAATAMDVLVLPENSISADSSSQQVALGIASADLLVIVTILDVSWAIAGEKKKVHDAKFRHFKQLPTVHFFPATKIAFSPLPADKAKKELQLASVSASNTLVVNRFTMTDDKHLSRSSGFRDTLAILLFSLIFIALLAVGLQLVFEHRGNLPKFDIMEVWEDVVETVKGSAKLGEQELHRMEKMGKKLKQELEGAGRGVREGLKKEVVQGVLEGVIGMG